MSNETAIEILDNQIREIENTRKKIREKIRELDEMETKLQIEEIKLMKAVEEMQTKKNGTLEKATKKLQEINEEDKEVPNSP